jgi:translation initiation factor IF-3
MKVKQAIWFLESRNSVKVEIRFRWREMAYQDMWIERMNEFAEALSEYWKVDQEAAVHWKKWSMSIIPLKKK